MGRQIFVDKVDIHRVLVTGVVRAVDVAWDVKFYSSFGRETSIFLPKGTTYIS